MIFTRLILNHLHNLSSTAKALEGSNPLSVNQNELSPIDVFGLVLLQRGGSSPFSKKFLYQCNAASTPCERLAKRLLSTCSSIQDNSSGVTVTLIFGLLSERIYSKILPISINVRGDNYTIILLLGSNGEPHDRNQPISASYGRTNPRTGHNQKHLLRIQREQSVHHSHGDVPFKDRHGRTEETDRIPNEFVHGQSVQGHYRYGSVTEEEFGNKRAGFLSSLFLCEIKRSSAANAMEGSTPSPVEKINCTHTHTLTHTIRVMCPMN